MRINRDYKISGCDPDSALTALSEHIDNYIVEGGVD